MAELRGVRLARPRGRALDSAERRQVAESLYLTRWLERPLDAVEAAERATEQAVKLAPTPLRDGSASIAPQVSRQKTIFRARYIGLSQRDAAEACKALKRKKLGCLILSPDAAAAGAPVASQSQG